MLKERSIRVEALDKNGNLLTGAQFKIFVNGNFVAETEGGKGFCTVHVSEKDAIIEVEVTYEGVTKRERIALNAEAFPVRFDVDAPIPFGVHDPIPEKMVVGIGVVFILLSVLLAVFVTEPTQFQWRVFGGVLSVGLAAFGLGLSGMINIRLEFKRRLVISATGALAIFILVYFFAPAQ